MKTLLIIHGPNLNMLGKRDPKHYGRLTLKSLEKKVKRAAILSGFQVKTFQSNHEGALIDFLQKQANQSDAVIINPGALAHYSYALHDALLDSKLPAVEVHLSKITKREIWRRKSVTAPACLKVISGKKENGYLEAIDILSRKVELHGEAYGTSTIPHFAKASRGYPPRASRGIRQSLVCK